MSNLPENSEGFQAWLEILTPITIEDFCQTWIPRFFDIKTDKKKEYRKACVTLLISLTKKQNKTVQNWITYPNTVPDDVKNYLGVVDLLWKFRWESKILFPEIEKLEKIYSILKVQGQNLLNEEETPK